MRYSDHEQREMDIKSGEELDKHAAQRMRWVNCEACGGSGEIIRRDHVGSHDDPSAAEYAEICAVCEGTGRDCVEPK